MPLRKAFVLYNYGEGQNATEDQQNSSNFVDHLKRIYRNCCEVNRFKKDTESGSTVLNTLIDDRDTADIICCIMTKDSDKNNFLKKAGQICFTTNGLFVVIGIGIRENQIPEYYQIQNNRCYANFEEAKMDTHFLNGIFRGPDEHDGEEEQNQEQLADEHGVEEVKLNEEKLPGEIEEVKKTQENIYDGQEVEEVNAFEEKISDEQEDKEENEDEKDKKGVWQNYFHGFLLVLFLTGCIYFGVEDKYKYYVAILNKYFFH